MDAWHYDEGLLLVSLSGEAMVREKSQKDGATNRVSLVPQGHGGWSSASGLVNGQCSGRQDNVVVVVSHIQRIGCQPEKNYFTRWPIPLVVC